MNRKIIAFAGSKGAGKSTAFETLNNNYPNVYDVTLAGHLKEVTAEIYNVDMQLFLNPKLKEVDLIDPICLEPNQINKLFELFEVDDFNYDNHVRPHVGKILETPRQLLQYLGTNVLHPIDPLIHAKYATKHLPKDGLVVITDLRFEDEFNFFYKDYKDEFTPFNINNTAAERAAEDDNHKSETDRHKFKHLCKQLDNNGTIYQFKGLVKSAVTELYNDK
tara:strand:+ start:73738 stop:74397 length:660 start_codon:yes stop_codon:yes gene_type:complete